MKQRKLQKILVIMGLAGALYLLSIIIIAIFFKRDMFTMVFPSTLVFSFDSLGRSLDIFYFFRVICMLLTFGIQGYVLGAAGPYIKQKIYKRPFPETKHIMEIILKGWAYPCYVVYTILDLFAFLMIKLVPLPVENLGPWPITVIGDIFLLAFFRLIYLRDYKSS